MDEIAWAFKTTVSAYALVIAPGHAWLGRCNLALDRGLAFISASAVWTSIFGLGLALTGFFSLTTLVIGNLLLAAAGYFRRGLPGLRSESSYARQVAPIGAAISLVALSLYWPPYEMHIASSDASTYTSAGIHLSREGRLWIDDELGYALKWEPDEIGPYVDVPPPLRSALFPSARHHPLVPPYLRIPGGLLIDMPHRTDVWPAFAALPMVWAAISTDLLNARAAGAYAPFFSALALLATWWCVRRRIGPVASAATLSLVALNAGTYYAASVAMAEPLAWFFVWATLAAFDAWEESGGVDDARLAGLFAGAAGLARIEFAILFPAALALRHLLESRLSSRPLTRSFYVPFAAMFVVTAAQAWLVGGGSTVPIQMAVDGVIYRASHAWVQSPFLFAVAVLLMSGAGVTAIRKLGPSTAIPAAVLVSLTVAYIFSGTPARPMRSITWLTAYAGWLAPAIAATGCVWVWRNRRSRSGDGFFLLFIAFVTACILFNPHVTVGMPSASRRFVPLVIPGVLLLAAWPLSEVLRRHRVVGGIAWMALALSVLAPARTIWGQPYYSGTYDQLEQVARIVPEDGTLLIDSGLQEHLLGIGLWLVHGRNNLPVWTDTDDARRTLVDVVVRLEEKGLGPVYLMAGLQTGERPMENLSLTLVDSHRIELRLPEQTESTPPPDVDVFETWISIKRLDVDPGYWERIHELGPESPPEVDAAPTDRVMWP